MDIRNATEIHVLADALAVKVVHRDTGEVLTSLPLQRGVHRGRRFLRYQTKDTALEWPAGVDLVDPPQAYMIDLGRGFSETAANPEFKPRQVTEIEKILDQKLRLHQASVARMLAQAKADNGGSLPAQQSVPGTDEKPDPAAQQSVPGTDEKPDSAAQQSVPGSDGGAD